MAKTNPSNLTNSPNPPGVWTSARSGIQRILAPVERFLAIQAASGILLIAAAVVALVWANSPWRDTYNDLWHFPIGITLGAFAFERELHFWINDGLMTIFFFVVGLEIRREIYAGELSEASRAALPVAAAFGGMIVPALVFIALNAGQASVSGWAVPMATDIAFAVGALALLGNRVSPALRILLLGLAIIDDVGAIVVIAVFYSSGINVSGFLILGLGMVSIVVLQMLGVRTSLGYVLPAALVWSGAYSGGIHPTLAGVIVGFMTPVRAWYGAEGFLHHIEERIRSIRKHGIPDDRTLLPHLDTLKVANREAISPAERLQHLLHGWVAFGIMPLFAFANAGVPLGQISFTGETTPVFLGTALGLLIGKPAGILVMTWMARRAGIASFPHGIGWAQIGIVGIVGGIGFTMALFIAQLAFPAGPLLETAKLGILVGSGLAGITALLVGFRILTGNPVEGIATSESAAENSTRL